MAKKRKQQNPNVGRFVTVDRDGADPRVGVLLADQKDHLVLYNDREGIRYCPKNRVTGVRLYEEETVQAEEQSSEGSPSGEGGALQYFEADRFASVLRSLRLTPIRFNRSADRVDGILADITRDEAIVVAGNEVVRVALSDIIDFGDIVDTEEEEEEEEDSNEDADEEGREAQRIRRSRNRNNRRARR